MGPGLAVVCTHGSVSDVARTKVLFLSLLGDRAFASSCVYGRSLLTGWITIVINTTPWAIFRSEFALGASIALLDTFCNRRVLWRFPPRQIDWIRSLGPAIICSGAKGPNRETSATLLTLLDLEDQLLDTEAFRQRLHARSVDHRGSEGSV